MIKAFLTPSEQEIDEALQANLAALKDSFRDLLAALCLLFIAIFSLIHAVLRIMFAFLGLLLWCAALLIKFLYWAQERAVKNSSSTLHRR